MSFPQLGVAASQHREFVFVWGLLLCLVRFASEMGTMFGVLRTEMGGQVGRDKLERFQQA